LTTAVIKVSVRARARAVTLRVFHPALYKYKVRFSLVLDFFVTEALKTSNIKTVLFILRTIDTEGRRQQSGQESPLISYNPKH
jgi:hypothetical protein